jgi:hypothetical protein
MHANILMPPPIQASVKRPRVKIDFHKLNSIRIAIDKVAFVKSAIFKCSRHKKAGREGAVFKLKIFDDSLREANLAKFAIPDPRALRRVPALKLVWPINLANYRTPRLCQAKEGCLVDVCGVTR